MQTISSLIASFSKIRRAYSISLQKHFVKESLSPNEISILILLSNNPTISTSRELVYFLDVSKGLISRSLDALVKKGYVILIPDSKDRRIQRIQLTDQAQPIIHRLQEKMQQINQSIVDGISIEDLQCTQRTILSIMKKLQEQGDKE